MPVRVLIAENDPNVRHQMRDLISSGSEPPCEVVGLARDGQEAIQMAVQLLPHLAFISSDLPGTSGLQACETISAICPDIMSVIVSGSKSSEKIEEAMRAGARGFVTSPLQARDVRRLIGDLDEARVRRSLPEVQEWKNPARFPKVVSITGAKGGVGKSTVAVNLAVTLAKRLPNRVALVDLYTQFGDVPTMLNIEPKRTLSELGPGSGELDTELIRNYVTEHPSGVHVLVASTTPLPLDALPIESLDSLLHVLKHTYRYVIMDMPPILHPTTLHVLAHSSHILLIANLFDLTTATDTKKFYDALVSERVSRENVRIVLNRVSKVNRLHTADIEGMFDCGVMAHIPNDSRLVTSVNKGEPLAMTDGDSPVGRSLAQLANALAGAKMFDIEPDKTIAKRGIFRAR